MKKHSIKDLKQKIQEIKETPVSDLPRMSAEAAARYGSKDLVCKFYADTPKQKNKLFHFYVKSKKQAFDLLIKALRSDMVIRAAYLNCPALKLSDKLPVHKLSPDMALSTE